MHIPTKDNFFLYTKLAILLNALFLIIYGGSNWLNSQRTAYWLLYSNWELNIPLIPEFIFLYFSFSVLTIVPIFFLLHSQIILLAKRMALSIIISGIIFLLLPTRLGYMRVIEKDNYDSLFSMLYQVDYPHNLFPSLHIALSTITLLGLLPYCSKTINYILSTWWILLCVSVVVVHQHHIADIFGGIIVAIFVMMVIKDKNSSLLYKADSLPF